ncbi:hypothetical protein MUK42_21339 [Musa troglodytarum]|uniref:Uncharacterized protein n=1 Tax=Musa troglodytarum TaxID=320322 RepID=A0A9E7FU81_9LILI|nr:hypothetical protein MUK42_21339 [Musa troglodytarum]
MPSSIEEFSFSRPPVGFSDLIALGRREGWAS